MDRQRLDAALRGFFDAYASARYQGVVMTVASEPELEQLRAQLTGILLDWDIWVSPGQDGAPDIPCSRQHFNGLALIEASRNLVIISPLEWMLDWPEQERSVFWTGVADLYGLHRLLVVVVETRSLVQQMRRNFDRHSLSGVDISVWLSKHQPGDGFEGLLS